MNTLGDYVVSFQRVRGDPDHAIFKEHSVFYCIRVPGDDEEKRVSRSAFVSLHGIGDSRIKRITSCIAKSGKAPVDHRGRHDTCLSLYNEAEV